MAETTQATHDDGIALWGGRFTSGPSEALARLE